LAFAWQGPGDERLLVTLNFTPNQSQCYVRLPFADLGDSPWRLEDLLGDAVYDRQGNDLQGLGLYLDVLPWKAHVFSMTRGRVSRVKGKRSMSAEGQVMGKNSIAKFDEPTDFSLVLGGGRFSSSCAGRICPAPALDLESPCFRAASQKNHFLL